MPSNAKSKKMKVVEAAPPPVVVAIETGPSQTIHEYMMEFGEEDREKYLIYVLKAFINCIPPWDHTNWAIRTGGILEEFKHVLIDFIETGTHVQGIEIVRHGPNCWFSMIKKKDYGVDAEPLELRLKLINYATMPKFLFELDKGDSLIRVLMRTYGGFEKSLEKLVAFVRRRSDWKAEEMRFKIEMTNLSESEKAAVERGMVQQNQHDDSDMSTDEEVEE